MTNAQKSKSLRRNRIIIAVILFLGTLLIEKIGGTFGYIFLAIASPLLIITSFVNSSILFYFLLFLYDLLIVWSAHFCFKKSKAIFALLITVLVIIHFVSYRYVQKALVNVAHSVVEGFKK